MKKRKITRKLVLNKETIVNLQREDLDGLRGGNGGQPGSGGVNNCTRPIQMTRVGKTCPVKVWQTFP